MRVRPIYTLLCIVISMCTALAPQSALANSEGNNDFSVTKHNHFASAQFVVQHSDGSSYTATRDFLRSFYEFRYTFADAEGNTLGYAQSSFNSFRIFSADGKAIGYVEVAPENYWALTKFQIFDARGKKLGSLLHHSQWSPCLQVVGHSEDDAIASLVRSPISNSVTGTIYQDGLIPQQILNFSAMWMLDKNLLDVFSLANLGLMIGGGLAARVALDPFLQH